MFIRNYQNNRKLITKRKSAEKKRLDLETIKKINSNLELLMEAKNNVVKTDIADWQKEVMAEEH